MRSCRHIISHRMITAISFRRAVLQENKVLVRCPQIRWLVWWFFFSRQLLHSIHAWRCRPSAIVGLIRAIQPPEELVEHHNSIVVGANPFVVRIFGLGFTKSIQISQNVLLSHLSIRHVVKTMLEPDKYFDFPLLCSFSNIHLILLGNNEFAKDCGIFRTCFCQSSEYCLDLRPPIGSEWIYRGQLAAKCLCHPTEASRSFERYKRGSTSCHYQDISDH